MRKKSDYHAERIRAELAFARSSGALTAEAVAEHLNKRGLFTRDGQPWTADDVQPLLDRRQARNATDP